jgi:hypothetical protein
MAYKIKYSRKEKKEQKKNKSLNQNNEKFDILNLPPNCWIDARDDYVFI